MQLSQLRHTPHTSGNIAAGVEYAPAQLGDAAAYAVVGDEEAQTAAEETRTRLRPRLRLAIRDLASSRTWPMSYGRIIGSVRRQQLIVGVHLLLGLGSVLGVDEHPLLISR
jgi:hypothetical protein